MRDRRLNSLIVLIVVLTVLAASEVCLGWANDGFSPHRDFQSNAQRGLNLYYFKGYLSHTKAIITSPRSWSQSSWLTFSALAAITAVVASEEDDIQQWIQANRTPTTDRIARTVKPLGNVKVTFSAMAALYAYGEIFEDDHAKVTALMALESAVITGGLTESIKRIAHKHRPGPANLDDARWDGPSLKRGNLSFPSGHAAHSFAVATVFASQYRNVRIVPPLAYTAATLCALSRLNDNKHWLSDVILGAALGHFTAKAVLGLHGAGESRLSLRPSSSGFGLALSYRF